MPVPKTKAATNIHKKTTLVAVIGNPNCGKTTLFNALTGLRYKVSNYPGVTVEKREGALIGHPAIRLLDLPGSYSLLPRSPDEEIAREVLLGEVSGVPRPDMVLLVVDATNLERHLYLASQIIELGFPAVLACNMMDLLEKSGQRLDLAKLSAHLGIPVIGTVGHNRQSLMDLRQALDSMSHSINPAQPRRKWTTQDTLEREIEKVAAAIDDESRSGIVNQDGLAVLLLSRNGSNHDVQVPPTLYKALQEARRKCAECSLDPASEIASSRFAWIEGVVADCLKVCAENAPSFGERFDLFATHRVWGFLFFGLLMSAMFYAVFILSNPLIDIFGQAVAGLQSLLDKTLPDGLPRDLLCDGVLAGVGAVVAFLPQICILFLFLAVLEDSGYMARATIVMDRIMRRVGLPGRSFIPLLSCHACAVPGIMATRTIENPRDRLATILIAPLMVCSARLPVYTMLIAACLPVSAAMKALVLLGLYLFGMLVGLGLAMLFKKTILASPRPTFMIELPPYRFPLWSSVLRSVADRCGLFLARAGTVILAMTVILWAIMNFPRDTQREKYYASRKVELVQRGASAEVMTALETEHQSAILQHSLAGRIGRFMEPAIRPLGYDWKIGLGLLSSFAARELFLGTMGVIYSMEQSGDDPRELREQLADARRDDGRKVFTPLVAASLLVFYALSCQCIGTIAVVRRETNSWRWPLFMFSYMTLLAYLAALLVYQMGTVLSLGRN